MVVNPEILEELYIDAGPKRMEKARKYVNENRVKITKVIYDDVNKFEVRSKVRGDNVVYDIYIQVEDGEIQDVSCTCEDYHQHYSTCKHILATIIEFSQNSKYIRIFSQINSFKEEEEPIYNTYHIKKNNEKYRTFKQLINAFHYTSNSENEYTHQKVAPHSINLIPKLIYNTYNKNLKVEFKIGDKHLYKLKNLPEFYDRMVNGQYYEYGSKLGFKHTTEAFSLESLPILNFLLKYAEIIKYANETSKAYAYYGTSLSDSYITISNTGMDELFDVLKGDSIFWQRDGKESSLYFYDSEPDIKFSIEKIENGEYKIYPNIDIYEYETIQGREYTYILINKNLYRCSKEFKENELKLLETFRNNFETQITFSENDLPQLFSLVFPKVKNSIDLDKLNQEEIQKYVPQELYVKVFLDYDNKNYITADIKFIYGDLEFNPLLEEKIEIARDLVKEDEVLELFRRTGFMLDIHNARLILVKDEDIYNFLSTEVEEFMQKFEVLATENFKQKEIKGLKVGNLGVRIENNLLKVDFSNIDFDLEELTEIMDKYKLKKKYHRLKDGSFLKLEQNESVDFLNSITEQIDIDYKELEKGELILPVHRSMYLDRLLQGMKTINVQKDEKYIKLVDQIQEKQINIELPKNLNANLREYQKIGYEWLKVLDEYKFGGILADDMGLGKTLQLIAVILSYIQQEENPKPSIVICPSSLSLNWENEINKFAPEIKALVIRGTKQERKRQITNIPKYNIVISSYELLKRDIELYKELNFEFKYMIVDEAQYIKNNNTQNAKAIKKINSETRYALTRNSDRKFTFRVMVNI